MAGAIALAGWVIATWGWRWFGPSPAPLPVAAVPDRWSAAISAAPLFGTATTPASPATVAQPAAAPTVVGEVRLLGVFAEPGGAGYALFRLGERGPVFAKAGAEIAKDVVLVEVRPDGVRVRDRGEPRELLLRPFAGAPRPAAAAGGGATTMAASASRAACAVPTGYKGPTYRLNAELLTGVAAQPDSWRALLAPTAGGLAVRDGSGFAAMLGMKPGDRVTQANGIALAGVDDMLTAFVNPLVASQPVHVVGTRDGKPADWLFVNAGACPG